MQFLGQIEGYAQPVAIFTSDVFRKPENHVKILLHLHGFLSKRAHLGGKPETFNDILEEFRFDSLLDAAGMNETILVVPSSLGKCDTYKHAFATKNGYESFLKNIEIKIKALELVPEKYSGFELRLSGHSGANLPLSSIMNFNCNADDLCFQKKLKSLTLLDATYSKFEDIVKFATLWPQVRMNISYLAGGQTSSGALELWKRLALAGVVSGELEKSKISLWDGKVPTDFQLRKIFMTNPVFIEWTSLSKAAHWKLARDFFWMNSI